MCQQKSLQTGMQSGHVACIELLYSLIYPSLSLMKYIQKSYGELATRLSFKQGCWQANLWKREEVIWSIADTVMIKCCWSRSQEIWVMLWVGQRGIVSRKTLVLWKYWLDMFLPKRQWKGLIGAVSVGRNEIIPSRVIKMVSAQYEVIY